MGGDRRNQTGTIIPPPTLTGAAQGVETLRSRPEVGNQGWSLGPIQDAWHRVWAEKVREVVETRALFPYYGTNATGISQQDQGIW